MTSIANIRDLIWRNLEGGDKTVTSRFTKREVAVYAKAGLAQAMKELFFEQLNQGEDAFKYFGGIGKTSTVKVETDDSGVQYITLKDKSLEFGGMRNYEITDANPFSRWAVHYVGIRPEEVIVSQLQRNIPNVIQYTIKDNKLVFFNGIVNDDEVTLNQKLVLPSGDDDEFEVPDEAITRAVSLAIQLAERELKVQDRTIDGVSVT